MGSPKSIALQTFWGEDKKRSNLKKFCLQTFFTCVVFLDEGANVSPTILHYSFLILHKIPRHAVCCRGVYFFIFCEPCAIAEVSIYGELNPAASNKMTALITEILATELDIPPARIYTKHDGIDHWGWNGNNF